MRLTTLPLSLGAGSAPAWTSRGSMAAARQHARIATIRIPRRDGLRPARAAARPAIPGACLTVRKLSTELTAYLHDREGVSLCVSRDVGRRFAAGLRFFGRPGAV